MGHTIELREPGKAPQQLTLEGPIVLGRDCEGIVCDDPELSRRHLEIRIQGDQLVVADLESTNGTSVNGEQITTPTPLFAGDLIRAGNVDIAILSGAPRSGAEAPPPMGPPQMAPPPQMEPPARATPAPAPPQAPPPQYQPPRDLRPAVDALESLDVEAAVIRFRPGTAGERAASAVAASAKRARRRLAGIGSEPWGARPQICLVDPFPDPDVPGEMMTSGTIVDAARDEIWMVVTPESPPEPLERPMALLFGMALPAGAELSTLLEGWGLHVADTPDPTPELRKLSGMPPLAIAEGPLRGAMALAFVKYLLEQGGEAQFRRLLGEARPGHVDETVQTVYGKGLAALEEAWHHTVAAGSATDVKASQFLGLAGRYLRPHKLRVVEILLHAGLGIAFTTIAQPIGTKRLLDSALPEATRTTNFTPIAEVIIFLVGVAILSWGAGLRSAYLSAYVSSAIVRDVRIQMFERLQWLSARWYGQRQGGDILSRVFGDVQMLEMGLSQVVVSGITNVVQLLVSSVMLFRLNARLAIITILGAPLVAIVYRLMSRGAQKRSMAVQEEINNGYNVVGENYQGISVVRAFALQAREIGRFRRASDEFFKKAVGLQLYTGLFGVFVTVVVTALQIGIMAYGCWLIIHGQLTIGALMAFTGLMGSVISPVTQVSELTKMIQESSGALVRVNEVLDTMPDIADIPDARPLAPLSQEIRLVNVSFSYTMERRTLDDVTLTIPAGKRVAFVGPTGAGKSSVLGLLQRNYDPDEGGVLFDGIDIREGTVESLRGQMGVVFQESFMFNATVRENIRMGSPNASDADIEAAADAAELHDFIMTLPRGYDTLVGERGGRFSGGQRQRLAIARALVRNPRVLILDEATSALDPRTERLISDTLERVSQGRTTVAVTHRLTSITDYDRIFVLVEGRLMESGTHDELLRHGGVYAMLWAEQTGAAPPAEAPFDVLGAVARVPLFAGLATQELGDIASRLQTGELSPGQRLPEGDRLFFVRRGRSRVLVPTLSGELAPVAELVTGDVFGVNALLGQERGAMLEALEHTSLLVLDAAALSDIAALFPAVGAGLTGAGAPSVAPAGGQRLERVSVRMERQAGGGGDGEAAAIGAEARRMSGAFRVGG